MFVHNTSFDSIKLEGVQYSSKSLVVTFPKDRHPVEVILYIYANLSLSLTGHVAI